MLVATFDVGDQRSTVGVPVFLDEDYEGEEEFMIALDVPSLYGGRVSAGNQRTAIGVISDPNGKIGGAVLHDEHYLTRQVFYCIQYCPVTTAHTCVNFCVVATCICNRGPREVKAVIHNHEWLKSIHDLKPCVVKSHALFKATRGFKQPISIVDTSGSSHS